MMTTMIQSPPPRVGPRVAALRAARGWSQRRLAAAAGVSHAYVALLERDRLISPGKFKLDAVARALGCRSADALVADDHLVTELDDNPSPSGPAGGATSASSSSSSGLNVRGTLEGLRSANAGRLPVYRWGSCGDPRDRDSPPDPDHLEFPPLGRESLIGPNGFGVMVRGDSMAARGIDDGDVVWVNPDRPYQVGKVVLALLTDRSGEAGMVVKTYARTDVGECLLSETASGRSTVVCEEFKVIGPVVGITSWRLPH